MPATEENVAGNSPTEIAANAERAHEALLADPSYQFEVGAVPRNTTPEWLRRILESELVASLAEGLIVFLQIAFWLGLVILVGVLCLVIYRVVKSRMGNKETRTAPNGKAYAPSARVIRDLLNEADALAGRLDYAGAARLLLQRSIEDVAQSRPGLVSRSMTAREIGALDILTEATRDAYGFIANIVERAHYAGLPIDSHDYQQARLRYGVIGSRKAS